MVWSSTRCSNGFNPRDSGSVTIGMRHGKDTIVVVSMASRDLSASADFEFQLQDIRNRIEKPDVRNVSIPIMTAYVSKPQRLTEWEPAMDLRYTATNLCLACMIIAVKSILYRPRRRRH